MGEPCPPRIYFRELQHTDIFIVHTTGFLNGVAAQSAKDLLVCCLLPAVSPGMSLVRLSKTPSLACSGC
jgi:hypothetical protein